MGQDLKLDEYGNSLHAAFSPFATAMLTASTCCFLHRSMSPDEWQPVPGSPCGGERWLLLYDRWAAACRTARHNMHTVGAKGLYDSDTPYH